MRLFQEAVDASSCVQHVQSVQVSRLRRSSKCASLTFFSSWTNEVVTFISRGKGCFLLVFYTSRAPSGLTLRPSCSFFSEHLLIRQHERALEHLCGVSPLSSDIVTGHLVDGSFLSLSSLFLLFFFSLSSLFSHFFFSLSSLFLLGVLTQTFAQLTSVSPVCCWQTWSWCISVRGIEQEVELEMEVVDCMRIRWMPRMGIQSSETLPLSPVFPTTTRAHSGSEVSACLAHLFSL